MFLPNDDNLPFRSTRPEDPSQTKDFAQQKQPGEGSFKILEQTELITKLAAGVVALTYVSGYLIETTYLGSFGLHAEAIEFFRAKYLYIGFHFWFCVSFFVVLLILAKRVFDFARAYQQRKETKGRSDCRPISLEDEVGLTRDEITTTKAILERKYPSDVWFLMPSFGDLRWNIIVSAIVSLFSIQILFMNVNKAGRVLPLQFIFLFTVALHQFTHFRENYSYWGILWGRMHAGFLRLVGTFVEAFLAIWIIYRVLYPHAGILTHHPKFYWILGIGFTAFASLIPFSLVNAPRQMARFDRPPEEKLSRFGAVVRRSVGRRGTEKRWSWRQWSISLPCSLIFIILLIAALSLAEPEVHPTGVFIFSKLIAFLDYHYVICFRWIGTLTLVLAFYIPLNIILMSLMRSEMYQKFGAKIPDPPSARRWSTLVLHVVPITVLYLVSVLTFAHTIYPKIPEEKAGGSYKGARLTRLYLIRDASTSTYSVSPSPGVTFPSISPAFGNLPPYPDVTDIEDGEHIVLEEDTNWLYIAKLDKDNCPEQWGRSMLEVSELRRPEVFSVNRNWVEYAAYTDRKTASEAGKEGTEEICPVSGR